MTARFAPTSALREIARAISWHRRLLAAALTAAAVAAALTALAPRPTATVRVVAAGRDLPGGHLVAAADLLVIALPRAVVPSGVLTAAGSAVGRLVAGPVRRGEPLTDVRLLGPSLLAAVGRPGLVAVPVRVADGGAAALVHAGEVVDVLSASDPGAAVPGGLVARQVIVLTVRLPAAEAADSGALVVVAADEAQATALAHAAGSRLTVAVRDRA
jgi:Flp pilus assembly protein CpaB